MGLDRFANFISKSMNTEGIEKININNNIKKIITNHVIFDLNFLIYQEINEIENEVNDLLKILLAFKNSNNINLLYNIINEILDKSHWKLYEPIILLLKNISSDTILNDFIKLLFIKISYNDIHNIKVIDLIIYDKILNTIANYINNLHYIDFIQTINIFHDGIPSLSKIIEQRKRRIKNYLEITEKKNLFKKYFDNLIINNKNIFECLNYKYKTLENNSNEIITFNYLLWIKNRFSIDKSIGPSSIFIENLEYYLKNNINIYFPNLKIYINNSYINGESDLKIFKFISTDKTPGDYCIHTTDSDLIHQMLVQQVYYKLSNIDINITVIKYIKNINLLGYILLFDGNLIINNILELYKSINNIKIINYKIIWDICLLFYFFGNDHIPSSLEIGSELGLEYYLKIHYLSLHKNNIVNIVNNVININLNNLLLILIYINNTNKINITKIILQRYFKINYLLIIFFTDKLNLDFYEILEFLEKFIIFRTLKMNQDDINKLNDNDLRKILLLKYKDNIDKYNSIEIFNLNINMLNIFNDYIDIIENNIDYYEYDYMGLIIYNKSLIITLDPYQDLYNFISDKVTNNLINKYPIFYDYINLDNHLNILLLLHNKNNNVFNSNDYIKKIYHLVISQFGDMYNYHTDNITYYKYYYAPPINSIIIFLQNSNLLDQTLNIKWDNEINNENINNDYFNFINHHLFISPFIINYNLSKYFKNLIIKLNLNNLWLTNINTFNYKDIDVKSYLFQFKNIFNKYNQINYLPLIMN